jgi:hypothetical protein
MSSSLYHNWMIHVQSTGNIEACLFPQTAGENINTCKGVCDYRRDLDSVLDLLTTYTQHSEQQVITALSLISILYKSSQHPLGLFQPAVFAPVVPWRRLLKVEILQLHALRSYLHSLPCRTQLSTDN